MVCNKNNDKYSFDGGQKNIINSDNSAECHSIREDKLITNVMINGLLRVLYKLFSRDNIITAGKDNI